MSGVVHGQELRAFGLYSEPYTTSLLPPLSSQGSVVFDCFEAALGAEVRIWSYTQPRYQKELNLTQHLPGKWLQVLPHHPQSLSCLATAILLLSPSLSHLFSGRCLSSYPPQGLSLLSPLPR